jgi:RNA polymerase sigma-70 factor (ECF subfamily)
MDDRNLLSEHLPRLYRMAWMLTGNEADAQDLAHDAMVSALTSFGRFRSEAKISTWLTAILINRHRTWRRVSSMRLEKREQLRSSPALDTAGPDAGLAALEMKTGLQRALDLLDEDDRLLIALSVYQGLDSTEIGDLLGRPPGTVRYQLHAAREKLRATLSEKLSHDR